MESRKRVYQPSPKHDARTGWASRCPDDLTIAEAGTLLDAALTEASDGRVLRQRDAPYPREVYARCRFGVCYVGKCEQQASDGAPVQVYHGYPVAPGDLPKAVLCELFRAAGLRPPLAKHRRDRSSARFSGRPWQRTRAPIDDTQ